MKTQLLIIKVAFFLLFSLSLKAQIFLNENFSGATFPPSGWQLQSVGTGDKTWYNFPNSTVGAIVWQDATLAQNERLITPTLDFSGVSNVYFTFTPRMYKTAMIDENTSDFFVKISTDNGTTWTTLWDDTQFDFGGQPVATKKVDVSLSNYTGAGMNQIKLMFQYTSVITTSANTALVQLYDAYVATCPKIFVTSHLSQVTWGVPTSFTGNVEIEYGPVGFTQSTGTIATVSSGNTYTIPNMNCKSYDYFIRAVCGTNAGAWSNRYSRKLVTSFNSSNITSSSAILSWGGFGEAFTIEYGPLNFTPGTGTTINVSSPTTNYQVTNLSPCTPYTARIKATCDLDNTWTSVNFTTTTGNNVPLTVPFTEAYPFTSTLCTIGYSTNSGNNFIELSSLRTVNTTNSYVNSRKMALQTGASYTFKIDARKYDVNTNTIGVINIKREGDATFVQNLFTFDNPNTTFSNYTTNFTPVDSDNYYLVFSFISPSTVSTNTRMYYDNLMVTQNAMSVQESEGLSKESSLYPNPFMDGFAISSEGKTITELKVLDPSGRLLDHIKNLNTKLYHYKASHLPTGNYIIAVKTGDIWQSHKAIKK